ncbi:hypothetical protein AQUCO_02000279v1 [Aquilegia coerulea]|uniref:F-box domain-containing protein n=1 Tax=Aquilegia coerulea TaxID=218851 RepID=A0A2G5DGV8_AQUCA|nr:hypothetical protein AQUCO_02000279v1 [Aquilegia coerulea]
MDVDWLKLPCDIIEDILNRLVDIDDYVRFGVVCKSWQYVKQANKRNQFSPWLLLPEGEINTQDLDNHNNYHMRNFFSLSSRKTLYLNLLETRGRRCFGSPFGWLFTIGLDLYIHLINPLTRIQISFPSQPTFQYQYECHIEPRDMHRIFISRFAISSNTLSTDQGNCVVMVIYSQFRKLAFARPGDVSWTAIENPINESHKDVISFKGHFYAVTVYKLDFDSMKWIELFDLGDYALFVGTNASFAVLTCDNPKIKRNSIYFTDDQDDCYRNEDGGGHDMGIFDFPNETFERFYLGDDIYSSYCPPVFFIPSLANKQAVIVN